MQYKLTILRLFIYSIFYKTVQTCPHKIINTGDYLLFMLRVREIVEELRVFERNKVPLLG